MTDFDAMSDSELAREAARLQGWYENDGGILCSDNGNPLMYVEQYDPASDLNDCAKLGAAFLAAWPDKHIRASMVVERGICDYLLIDGATKNGLGRHIDASEARARTVAVLKAWAALDG